MIFELWFFIIFQGGGGGGIIGGGDGNGCARRIRDQYFNPSRKFYFKCQEYLVCKPIFYDGISGFTFLVWLKTIKANKKSNFVINWQYSNYWIISKK